MDRPVEEITENDTFDVELSHLPASHVEHVVDHRLDDRLGLATQHEIENIHVRFRESHCLAKMPDAL